MSFDLTPRHGDTENNLLFKIAQLLYEQAVSGGGGGGGGVASLTPWTENIDGAGFNLSGVNTLRSAEVGVIDAARIGDTDNEWFIKSDLAAFELWSRGSGGDFKWFSIGDPEEGCTLYGTYSFHAAGFQATTEISSPKFIGASGTLTASAPVLDLSQTWNNAAVTFTGLKLNVTNTASAAASLLMDLQVAGATVLSVRRDGALMLKDNVGIVAMSAGNLPIAASSGWPVQFTSGGGILLSSGAAVRWGTFPEVNLVGEAASILAQRNGTNAQTFRIYNTFTDASNYERGFARWNSNVFEIGVSEAGTGTSRALSFLTASTARWNVSTAGHFLAATDNTYDIGASGANRPKAIYIADENSGLNLSGKAWIRSYFGDGNILLNNNARTGFDRLQFGGTTSSFPALKRSTTTLQARLADDSDFTILQGKIKTHANYAAGAPTATGYLVLFDAAGNQYKVPAEPIP
jgi:hypothetical protein